MARDRKVDVVIGAKDRASKVFKTVGASVVVMNQAIELASKLGRGLQDAYDFAKMGGEVEKAEFAFNRMSEAVGANADEMLNKIRRLTGGTISDFELMRKAAKATTLGIPIDKIGEFAEVARAAAAAMGESTDFMFDSIVTGTARQSKLILDNLGIMIDMGKVYADETKKLGHALSETEKKQAFMNAVIEAGQSIVNDIGDTSELTSEKFAKFEAAISNLRDTIATILAGPIGSLLVSLANMADRLRWVLEGTNAFTEAIQSGDLKLETWNETFEESIGLMDKYLAGMAPGEEKIGELTDALITEEQIQALVNEGLRKFRESLGQVPADATMAVDGINNVRTSIEELNEIIADPEPYQKRLEISLEASAILRKNALAIMKFLSDLKKKELKEFEEAEAAKLKSVQAFVDVSFASLERLSHQLIDDWGNSKLQLRDLFKGMAQDFLHFFIDKILTDMKLALVAKLMKMLIFIGPHHENDMMIVEMGRKYAGFFQQGVFEGMNMDRFAGGMISAGLPSVGGGAVQIGAAVPAAGTTIIIQGNVIGEDEWLTEKLIPAIEEKITNRETAMLGIEGTIESLI